MCLQLWRGGGTRVQDGDSLYPRQQPVQSEVFLRPLDLVDVSSRHLPFWTRFPPPQNQLQSLLEGYAHEKISRELF